MIQLPVVPRAARAGPEQHKPENRQDQYADTTTATRHGLPLPQLAQVGVGELRRLDADPGVDGHGTVAAGDDGTQV